MDEVAETAGYYRHMDVEYETGTGTNVVSFGNDYKFAVRSMLQNIQSRKQELGLNSHQNFGPKFHVTLCLWNTATVVNMGDSDRPSSESEEE